MANKQLTARVKLNISDAEQKLKKLNKLFHNLDKVTNSIGDNNKVEKQLNRNEQKVQKIVDKVKSWKTAQQGVTSATRATDGILSSISRKIRNIAATYLGIMGLRGAITTSDTITKTQNKLNNLNGGDFNLTQQQMDQMYTSANKVRMSYADMMANASKSMVLAGDAFGGNMDNAIRFQEIMAESYALGGASAQEMSSSMYQIIQALGSGTLAGDELRSVREGAPLAYREIEKFAQGIYNTTDSLKDMASQGLITSDIVVAAIMNAGDKIDAQFGNTAVTFEQAWDRIKNSAVKAFEPVSIMLNKMLNQAVENGAFEKIEQFFWNLSKVIQVTFKVIEKVITWIVDQWNWLKYVVIFALTMIGLYLMWVAGKAIATAILTMIAWVMMNGMMLATIGIIALIVVALVWLATQCSSVCEFIYNLCIGLAWGIIAVLALVLIAYLATGVVMLSIPTLIALLVVAVLAFLIAIFVKFTGEIIGCVLGIYYAFGAIWTNIQIGWQNMCAGLRAFFWNAIADMLEGCDWLVEGINKIITALGKSPITIGAIRAKADAASAQGGQSYVNVGDAWNTGYSKGYAIGQNIQSTINGWSGKLSGGLNGLGSKLGLDFSKGFPSGGGVGGGYSLPDDLLNDVADTAGNTGSMAKAMDLAEEDLAYLRKVAEMEWKKEYTTASITVDMSNYNNINGETDLDGIVTKLADKLYEEMNIVANGVYA